MATCWALLSFGIDHTRNLELPGGPSRSEFILKTCEHQLCLPSRNHTSVLYFTDCVHVILFNHYNKYSIIVYAYTCSIWSKLIHCTRKDTRFLISIYREMEAKWHERIRCLFEAILKFTSHLLVQRNWATKTLRNNSYYLLLSAYILAVRV